MEVGSSLKSVVRPLTGWAERWQMHVLRHSGMLGEILYPNNIFMDEISWPRNQKLLFAQTAIDSHSPVACLKEASAFYVTKWEGEM